VPAYLPVQSNEWDPSNAVLVAMMKYWNERWGAELVAMAPSNVEMRVLRPPTTWEEAFMLAKEQYIGLWGAVERKTTIRFSVHEREHESSMRDLIFSA
jgi:hypothetical protein